MTAPDIIYLHGFRSAPQSSKAQALVHYLESVGYPGQWHVPRLAVTPAGVEQQLTQLIQSLQGRPFGLIGSSLGGFFASAMAERFDVPAVLINPAVRPYELLTDYQGEQTNLYTGEVFEVTGEHLEQLRALDPPRIRNPERLMVLVQTGDETLDYRQAVERFSGANLVIEEGGDHRFTTFEQHLPAIVDFLGKGVEDEVQ